MENKHIWKVCLLLALMFLSSVGQNIETMLKMGMSYDIAGGYAFLLASIYLCIISIVMMLIPFVCRIYKREKLPYKLGKRVCIWNSVLLFVLPIVLNIPLVGGLGALIYYFVNRWVFVMDKNDAEAGTSAESDDISETGFEEISSKPTSTSSEVNILAILNVLITILIAAILLVLLFRLYAALL